jgi:hypothetical protein
VAPPTWQLHREHLSHEGHETMWMLGSYLGLREVFADYSRLAAPESPTTSVLRYYAKLRESLGDSIVAPKRILRNVIDDLVMEGHGAAAREAYNQLVSAYGAPANAGKLDAEIAESERRPPPAETIEGLLATPFPTPAEAQAYIGEWIGDVWMNPDEPRSGKETLRIKVVDGRVVGETFSRGLPADIAVQKWTYLKVTKDGLTYGFMNGMRPRGMLLFEAKRTGDTLAGDMRFGGINFHRPDGDSPPPLHFSFKKVNPQTE